MRAATWTGRLRLSVDERVQVPLSTRLRLGGRDVYRVCVHQEGPQRSADPGSSLFYYKMLSDGT